jgi:hypothetical protein
MRVAVLVVSMLVLATTSEASRSCMSKTEARRHFGSVHIYWHGADHCWDATSTGSSHQAVRRAERKIDQPGEPESRGQDSRGQNAQQQDFKQQDFKQQDSQQEESRQQASKQQASGPQDSKPQDSKPRASKWRVSDGLGSNWRNSNWQDSMSKMLPDDKPARTAVQRSWTDRWVDIEPIELSLAARWVDIAPVTPPLSKSAPDPELRMMVLGLAFIVIALTLAMIQVLFRAFRGAGEKDRALA